MNTEIKSRNDSALPRSEVQAIVTFDGTTPSRQELIKNLSSKLKSKAELVVIKNIYTAYGDKEASIIAYIYDNEDALKSIEYKTMIEKNTLKKEEPKDKESKSSEAEQPSKASSDKPAEKAPNTPENAEAEKPAEEKKEEAPKAKDGESNTDSQSTEKGE